MGGVMIPTNKDRQSGVRAGPLAEVMLRIHHIVWCFIYRDVPQFIHGYFDHVRLGIGLGHGGAGHSSKVLRLVFDTAAVRLIAVS